MADLPHMAAHAASTSIQPDMIVSSPALRTRLTAQAFQERLQPQAALLFEPALYDCMPDELWEIVKRFPDELDQIMIVGHNTCLEEVLMKIDPKLTKFPTCGLATLQLSIDSWQEMGAKKARLSALSYPKMLQA